MGRKRYEQQKSKKGEFRGCQSRADNTPFRRRSLDASQMRHENLPQQPSDRCFWFTLAGGAALVQSLFRRTVYRQVISCIRNEPLELSVIVGLSSRAALASVQASDTGQDSAPDFPVSEWTTVGPERAWYFPESGLVGNRGVKRVLRQVPGQSEWRHAF